MQTANTGTTPGNFTQTSRMEAVEPGPVHRTGVNSVAKECFCRYRASNPGPKTGNASGSRFPS